MICLAETTAVPAEALWMGSLIGFLTTVLLIKSVWDKFAPVKEKPRKPSLDQELAEMKAAHASLERELKTAHANLEVTMTRFMDTITERLDDGAVVHINLAKTQGELQTAQAVNTANIVTILGDVGEIKQREQQRDYSIERQFSGMRAELHQVVRDVFTHSPNNTNSKTKH